MGGAKNCPETPRQKMIGMMYLVLTAMLALNVSADIINGYAQVDDSLHSTIRTVEADNSLYYRRFEAAMAENPEKTREWYERAQQVRQKSDEFYTYVQDFKDQLVLMADGADKAKKNATVREMGKKDDTNIPHQYGLNEGNAANLKDKIVEYRQFMDQITNGNKTGELNATFNVDNYEKENGEVVTWEEALFHEMPVCATLTMLTKIQNDIRTEENATLVWLDAATDAGDVRVNKMNAYVIPKSDYVIKGNKYSARIIMAGIDSTQTPDYYVNGQQIGKDGIYEFIASGDAGERKYTGKITYKTPDGTIEELPFESKYTVGEPNASISNKQMNIMYRNFDNRYSISVPGVKPEQVKVEVQGGATIRRDGGDWLIKPNDKAENITIIVKADMDGNLALMGENKYRVKPLPKPSAFFVADGNTIDEGTLAKKIITSTSSFIEASYGPDGILDLPFKITSFAVTDGRQTFQSKSDHMTAEQRRLISQMGSGDIVTINAIHALGPDGEDRKLNTISLKIK